MVLLLKIFFHVFCRITKKFFFALLGVISIFGCRSVCMRHLITYHYHRHELMIEFLVECCGLHVDASHI